MSKNTDILMYLFNKIRNGKMALFFGAGASVSSGGPTSGKLIDILYEKFPETSKDNQDFNEICDSIIHIT